jgi:hypothetical protein
MTIIAHRINTSSGLLATPRAFGVEMDLRLHNSELVCAHDPLTPGESFRTWLKSFNHGTLICNLKEEGIEDLVIEELQMANVEDYFFLDQSFPHLVKYSKNGHSKAAVRVSEYESVDTALTLAGLVDWVWVDIFTKFPLTHEGVAKLRNAGFKFCLVSPELHGRFGESAVEELKAAMRLANFSPDAICTKRPEIWEF